MHGSDSHRGKNSDVEEAIGQDFLSVLKEFWQTVWQLSKGKLCFHTIYSGVGELLTSTESQVGE